jgi:hypothetical protein
LESGEPNRVNETFPELQSLETLVRLERSLIQLEDGNPPPLNGEITSGNSALCGLGMVGHAQSPMYQGG